MKVVSMKTQNQQYGKVKVNYEKYPREKEKERERDFNEP